MTTNNKKEKLERRKVFVCQGTGCMSSNSAEIREKLENEVKKAGLDSEVEVSFTGCHGFCALSIYST